MAKILRGTVAVGRILQGNGFKVRPVVVIQNDLNNVRLTNVIAAMLTSNTRLASQEATQVLIDMTIAANKVTGLLQTSTVKCENIYTIPITELRAIGSMPSSLMQKVDTALKSRLI
jgi:mRNA-degrading endonuclease toxin of MazEF toxin-antitoxin module